MNRKTLDLNGEWELRYCDTGEGSKERFGSATDGWIPASVPGDVHLDLMRAGQMEEPLYGLNAKKCTWVEEKEWWYRKIFEVPKDELNSCRIELHFEGLDTTAEVWLNGKKAGENNNMLVPCTFDITKFVRAGKNILLVRLDCGRNAVKDRPLEKYQITKGNGGDRIWIRKVQFMFGWDWAPRLLTCGIWRPVRIVFYKQIALRGVFLSTKIFRKKAVVKAEAEIENFTRDSLNVEIIASLKKKRRYSAVLKTRLNPGINRIVVPVSVVNPELWYPRPLGEQPLYEFNMEVKIDKDTVDSYQTGYGIREVRLLQKPLGKGEKSWTFAINGKKVFCKGADWVPADSIPARVSEEKYRKLVELAVEANFNMFRVWGGGIYEDERFYRVCDEMGVMVWQEFIFACALYPDDDENFCAEVKKEAELVVKQLRNHPSLVLWCGNNENDWGWKTGWWPGASRFYGEKIYAQILPEVCRRLDPSRPYWQSSPFGGKDPNSDMEGDRHTWWISIQSTIPEERYNYKNYARDASKFTSEFGLLAPSTMETLKKCIPPEELNPSSESWKFHANTIDVQTPGGYLPKILKVLYDDNPEKLSIEEFTLALQLMQGEGYKFALEHYRRRKFNCSGSLFWMYADCWGAASGWTIVDYYLNRKPSFFFVKRAYAPLLVSIKEEEFGLSVWLINDLLKGFSGTIEYGLKDFFGKEFMKKKIHAQIPANSSRRIVHINEIDRLAWYNTSRFFYARFRTGNRILSENRYFFTFIKGVKPGLPEAKLEYKSEKIKDDLSRLTIKTDNYAWAVQIELPEGLVPEDNYFDIFPGEKKEVLIKGNSELVHGIKVKAMNSIT